MASVPTSNKLPATTAVSERRRKRMRIRSRIQPWKDSWELEETGRSLLLSRLLLGQDGELSTGNLDQENQARLQHALQTVAVWKVRADHGRLPHAIDTTYSFAQLLFRDAQLTESPPDSLLSSSSAELRLAYASALVRGVNGLADVMQQQRAVAASVASLCEQMGLPGWLVDLRHDSAHNDLPSLPMLRLAAKTFLGYLEDRYWIPMANARQEIHDRAIQLLVKYKAASKGSQVVSSGEIRGDANDSGRPETNATGKANDESSSSSSSSEEDEAKDAFGLWDEATLGTSQNRYAALFESSRPKKQRQSTKKRRKTTEVKQKKDDSPMPPRVLSPSHYAKEYVKHTPIDTGHQVALSYLVWGGVGDAPEGRGTLIPGSVSSFPETPEGFERVKIRYSPLILTITGAWTGFTVALLNHLVEYALSIEETPSDAESIDASSARKLYFVSAWVQFLLSREFHSCCNKSLARMGKTDLLKKPLAHQTEKEREFLQGPAPRYSLEMARFPLLSLLERCSSAPTNAAKSIAELLRGAMMSEEIFESEQPLDQVQEASSIGRPLSLDQMESLLAGKDSNAKALGRDEKAKDHNEHTRLDESQGKKATTTASGSKRWELCDTWEACAIGSLPGRLS